MPTITALAAVERSVCCGAVKDGAIEIPGDKRDLLHGRCLGGEKDEVKLAGG